MTTDGGARRTSNAFLLFGGELGSRLLAFVATAYLATTLGPSNFGIIGFAFAFYSYLVVAIDAGFSDVGSRAVAQDLGGSASLAASVTIVRLVIAAVLFTGIWLLSPAIEQDETARAVLILTCLLLFTAALDTTWVFRGQEKGLRISVSLVLRRLIYAALVFLWIGGPEDLLRVPVTQVVGELVGVLWLGLGILVVGIGEIDIRGAWRTYWSARSLIVAKFLRTSIVTLDVVLLGFMSTDEAVGLYSAPYRIVFVIMALAMAVQVAYLPDVSRSVGGDLKLAASRHLEASLGLGIPITVGGLLLAEPMVVEIFGAEYRPATDAFRLLLLSVAVLFAFTPLHNVLLAQDRLRFEFWFFGVAAVLNAVLNVLWIPRYGIVGAAAATMAVEYLILGLTAVTIWSSLGWELIRPGVKPLVASLVMAGGLVVLSPGHALLVGIPLGALIYGICLAALGGLPRDIQAVIARLFAREGES